MHRLTVAVHGDVVLFAVSTHDCRRGELRLHAQVDGSTEGGNHFAFAANDIGRLILEGRALLPVKGTYVPLLTLGNTGYFLVLNHYS